MSHVQNQQFVQIATGKLKDRLRQFYEENGIEFIETEEASTSKASFKNGSIEPFDSPIADGTSVLIPTIK